MSLQLGPANRRAFIGGSDARIIMGDDEAALVRLWREKRGREASILPFFLWRIGSLASDSFRGSRRFGRCGGFCGSRGSGPSKAHARLIAICELDSGCLECPLKRVNCSLLQFISALKPGNRVDRHLSRCSELSNAQT